MKPESIKNVLRSYLNERQHPSSYNDFVAMPCAFLSPGKPFHSVEDMDDDKIELQYGAPQDERNYFTYQSAGPPQDQKIDLEVLQHQFVDLPWDEQNVLFEPQLDELAVGVGRRLSQMSDEFDLNHLDPVHFQASANDNRCIRFKEHIIRLPATCNSVQIPVIRTRAADSEVNVTWRTCDKSAKAGIHYVDSQGSISFAQNDEEKTIEVEIIRDLDRSSDIHFVVELLDAEGTFNTLTVYIFDDSRLYPEEKQWIQNIFSCAPNNSMSKIVNCLHGRVTHNTFKAALQCLCCNADTIPKELALGAELLRLTMHHAPLSTLTNVFCEYFSYLPELEDIAHLF